MNVTVVTGAATSGRLQVVKVNICTRMRSDAHAVSLASRCSLYHYFRIRVQGHLNEQARASYQAAPAWTVALRNHMPLNRLAVM